MRKFGDDGPTRSELGNKIQYEGFMSPFTVRRFGEYMRKHQVQEDGNKRESDNWQKGIPLKSYVDSMLRHMVDVWGIYRGAWTLSDDGCDLEDVLCGVKFNVDGMLHELVKARTQTEGLKKAINNIFKTIPAGTAMAYDQDGDFVPAYEFDKPLVGSKDEYIKEPDVPTNEEIDRVVLRIKYHCSQCSHYVPAGLVCLKDKLLLTLNPEVGNCPYFEKETI